MPTAKERTAKDRTPARDPRPRERSTRSGGKERKPKSPYPPQHQAKPGRESELRPRPRYEAPEYHAAGKLEGKSALITGGDSGIGRAVLIPGDLTDESFCRECVETAVRRLGSLDVLVNNAAFQQGQETLEKITDDQWDHTFKTNIYAYFRVTKAALRHLGKGSAIVNTGSITGLQGSKELLDYSATKGAINAFTKALAQNLVERGIRVNCVAPGPVWTPLNPADKPREKVAKFGGDTPMGRPAQPEEIAPAYVYFASAADSSYVTGEVLTLLGGRTTAA